jgi:acyl-phosphate glycerol 3-phosphate acyltransferase
MENFWLILIAVIAYLLGSFPTAYLINKDVLKRGSGNVGTMNVLRTTGSKKLAVFTLVLDVAKAVLAVFLVSWLAGLGYNLLIGLLVASAFVILGHNYSVFLKFKGGRGLASLFGVVLALNWLVALLCLATLVVTILLVEAILILFHKSERNFGNLFSLTTLNSQILGRVIGMALCLLPIYLLIPQFFLAVMPAIALSLLRHGDRLLKYLNKKTVG